MRTLRTMLSTVLLVSSALIWAQTNTFPEDGNVGIGTTTPENYDNWGKVLNVYATYASKITTASSDVNTGIWSHSYGFYGAPAGGMLGTYSNHAVSLITNKSARMTITASGDVGIGTITPSYTLDINGSLRVRGPEATVIRGDLQIGAGGVYQDMILSSGTAPEGYNGLFEIATRSIPGSGTAKHATHFKTVTNGPGSTRHDILVDGNVGIGTTALSYRLDVAGDINFTGDLYKDGVLFSTGGGSGLWSQNAQDIFYPSGNVGIGTTDPGDYRLAVEGKVGAREVEVRMGSWADFVFEEGYDLRSLEEVEHYIGEHGHLPDMPSEDEVLENGIDLGEMNAKLLQKIEELMLYTIAQQKEIQRLQEAVGDLEE